MNYNDDFREKLNLDDLYSNKKEEFQGKIKVYQNLLARVHKKIKHTSRQRNNDCYCFYVIPEFIFGIPKYDVAACTSYIIQKLQENQARSKRKFKKDYPEYLENQARINKRLNKDYREFPEN